MFCRNCGTQLEEGKKFCPNCGAAVGSTVETPVVEAADAETIAPAPVYQEAGSYTAPSGEAPDAGSVMTKGIVAAALGVSIGIPGIILGNIAMKAAQKDREAGYPYSGKLKAGYITGKIGKIFGIIMTIFWAIYIVALAVIGAGIGMGMRYGSGILDMF